MLFTTTRGRSYSGQTLISWACGTMASTSSGHLVLSWLPGHLLFFHSRAQTPGLSHSSSFSILHLSDGKKKKGFKGKFWTRTSLMYTNSFGEMTVLYFSGLIFLIFSYKFSGLFRIWEAMTVVYEKISSNWGVMAGDVTSQQFHTKSRVPSSNKVLVSPAYGILSPPICAPPPLSSKITEYVDKLKTAQRTAFGLACQKGRFCVLCLCRQPMKTDKV